MSSIANEINDDNDDFDELTFTPQSALISPLSNNERQPSLIPPSDENFTIDPPSEVSQEPLPNGNKLITEEKRRNSFLDVMEIEPLEALEPTLITCHLDPTKNSTPGTIDTLDFPYDFLQIKFEIVFFSSRTQNRRHKLAFEIRIMQPILRFLQLLCENHNPEFQVCEFFIHHVFQ